MYSSPIHSEVVDGILNLSVKVKCTREAGTNGQESTYENTNLIINLVDHENYGNNTRHKRPHEIDMNVDHTGAGQNTTATQLGGNALFLPLKVEQTGESSGNNSNNKEDFYPRETASPMRRRRSSCSFSYVYSPTKVLETDTGTDREFGPGLAKRASRNSLLMLEVDPNTDFDNPPPIFSLGSGAISSSSSPRIKQPLSAIGSPMQVSGTKFFGRNYVADRVSSTSSTHAAAHTTTHKFGIVSDVNGFNRVEPDGSGSSLLGLPRPTRSPTTSTHTNTTIHPRGRSRPDSKQLLHSQSSAHRRTSRVPSPPPDVIKLAFSDHVHSTTPSEPHPHMQLFTLSPIPVTYTDNQTDGRLRLDESADTDTDTDVDGHLNHSKRLSYSQDCSHVKCRDQNFDRSVSISPTHNRLMANTSLHYNNISDITYSTSNPARSPVASLSISLDSGRSGTNGSGLFARPAPLFIQPPRALTTDTSGSFFPNRSAPPLPLTSSGPLSSTASFFAPPPTPPRPAGTTRSRVARPMPDQAAFDRSVNLSHSADSLAALGLGHQNSPTCPATPMRSPAWLHDSKTIGEGFSDDDSDSEIVSVTPMVIDGIASPAPKRYAGISRLNSSHVRPRSTSSSIDLLRGGTGDDGDVDNDRSSSDDKSANFSTTTVGVDSITLRKAHSRHNHMLSGNKGGGDREISEGRDSPQLHINRLLLSQSDSETSGSACGEAGLSSTLTVPSSSYGTVNSVVKFTEEFEDLGTLGQGNFARVSLARWRLDGQLYAVKRSLRQFRSRQDRRLLVNEVKRMKHIQAGGNGYPFILGFVRAWQEDGYFLAQLELAPGGSLADMLLAAATVGQVLSDELVLLVAHDLLSALARVHSCGTVHLDVKPANLLRGRDGCFKLCDFGSSVDVGSASDDREGDSRYMAPELLDLFSAPVQPAADLFSAGLTLLEAASIPVTALPAEGPMWHMLRQKEGPEGRPTLKQLPGRPHALQTLVNEAAAADSALRPTAVALLRTYSANCLWADAVRHREPLALSNTPLFNRLQYQAHNNDPRSI